MGSAKCLQDCTLQHIDDRIELTLAAVERRRQDNRIARSVDVARTGVTDEARVECAASDVQTERPFLRERRFPVSVGDELDTNEEPPAAHVADRINGSQFRPQVRLERLANLQNALNEPLIGHDF